MRRRIAALALLGSLVLAAAAAAHEDGKPGKKETGQAGGHGAAIGAPGDPGKVTRTIAVEMSDAMRFKPDSIRVKKGETVRFVVTNAGKLKHEMVLGTVAELKEHAALMRKFPEMEHDDPNQVVVEPGGTGELVWRFSQAGTFDFACLIPGHFESGMVGKIRVER